MRRLQYDGFGGPEVMYLGSTAPAVPGRDEVRVTVKAAAINPLDWKVREGAMKIMIGKKFPKGMGHDFAGVVDAVGPGVSDLTPGDAVFGTMDLKKAGAFAEQVVVKRSLVARMPDTLSFAQASCLPIPAMTAAAALLRAGRAKAGSRVLIYGCTGAVGATAVQLAKAEGMRVVGVCGERSREAAGALGLDEVHTYGHYGDYARKGRFDVIFDTVGTFDVGEAAALLGRGGRLVDINPTPGRMLRGLMSRRYRMAFATMGIADLPAIAKWAAAGKLAPTVGREVSIESAAEVLTQVQGGLLPGRTVIIL